MKGFLSLLTVTLIAVFCGLILLTFYSEPLEEWQNQERLQAYSETRENTIPVKYDKIQQAVVKPHASHSVTAYTEAVRSCPAP